MRKSQQTTKEGSHRQAGSRWALTTLLASLALWAPGDGVAASDEARALATLESAYLLNFVRFSTWPDDAHADATSPTVIGILGTDHLGPILDAMLAGETVRGRAFEVRRFPSSDDAMQRWRECHVLFIGRSEESHLDRVLFEIAGSEVLTVSDLPQFTEAGGMVGLSRQGRRLTFDVNVSAIGRTGITTSSKLLRLARKVRTTP